MTKNIDNIELRVSEKNFNWTNKDGMKDFRIEKQTVLSMEP